MHECIPQPLSSLPDLSILSISSFSVVKCSYSYSRVYLYRTQQEHNYPLSVTSCVSIASAPYLSIYSIHVWQLLYCCMHGSVSPSIVSAVVIGTCMAIASNSYTRIYTRTNHTGMQTDSEPGRQPERETVG